MVEDVSRPVIVVVGTRPEGIKMLPVYCALKQAGIPVMLCSTTQHRELLSQVFDVFKVSPDIDFDVMRPGQDLVYLTQAILQKSQECFNSLQPSLVLVQGDTTSAMAAAMAAFYLSIPVGHVEAGLRTFDIIKPFPEEMNRRIIGLLATYHFAPTLQAAAHLLAEGVARDKVFCTGNTSVDALRMIKEGFEQGTLVTDASIVEQIAYARSTGKKILLFTVHRRESFGGGVSTILQTVKNFLQCHPEIYCIYPYHPNPVIREAINQVDFSTLDNMYLCTSLAYKELVYVLLHADGVATDSGGIQEEAVSLGKQVVVLREQSERMEGVWAGFAHLVGTDPVKITQALSAMFKHNQVNDDLPTSIYGTGYAAQQIVHVVRMHMHMNINNRATCVYNEKGME